MGTHLFSGVSEVAIQGKRVLRFVDCAQERAEYVIIGFENPRVVLIDRRKTGLQAVQDLLRSGELSAFAPAFNSVSQVDIWNTDDGGLLIELNDSTDEYAEHVLWIAVGIGDTIPAYDYVLEHIAPIDNMHYAFIGLYHDSASISESNEAKMSIISSSSSGPWAG